MKTQEKWLENDPQYDQHERDAAADMLYLHFAPSTGTNLPQKITAKKCATTSQALRFAADGTEILN